MGVKESALFAKEVNHFDWIAALPEEVAEVAVRADFFADGFAEFHERSRVVDDKVRVHFEREAFDAMITRVFGGFLPVGDDFFFPLPILHLRVLGRPAIGRPVGHGVACITSRASRESDDDVHS